MPAAAEKKRAGKITRISLACSACRRLKRRCSGSSPCDQCTRAGRTPAECIFTPRNAPEPNEAAVSDSASPPVATALTADTTFAADLSQDVASQTQTRPEVNALTFLDLVQAAVLGETAYREVATHAPFAISHVQVPDENLFDLPDPVLAKAFIDRYFEVVAAMFPLLHAPSTLAQCEAFLAQSAEGVEPDPLWLSFFYGLCAVGVTGVVWQDDAALEEDFQQFYARSKALLAHHNATVGTISLLYVQTLLLHVYVIIVRNPHIVLDATRGANACAELQLATSAAISLRLHEKPEPGQFDPLTAELRKRAFTVCYNWGMFLSLIAGTVPLSATVTATVGLPGDWPDGTSAATTVFMHIWTQMCQCGSEILTRLYRPSANETQVSIKLLMELESKLEEWRAGLPPEWRIDVPAWQLENRHQMLKLRYCYTRLVLLRPALVRCLNGGSEQRQPGGIKEAAWHSAYQFCLEAARELISTSASIRKNTPFRTAHLYHSDFVQCALSVLLWAKHRGQVDDIEQLWDEAVAGIREALPSVADRLELLKAHLSARAMEADTQDLMEQLLLAIGD